MKTNISNATLTSLLLGGLLIATGCSTPTTTVGAVEHSEKTVLQFRSPVPSQVQCVWMQDGAMIQHSGVTPFRLVVPGDRVSKVTILKADQTGDVTVEIRSPRTDAARFVMAREAGAMDLVQGHDHWESKIYRVRQ